MAEDFTVIDVFAGAGGLSLGFEQAGLMPVLGVDGDPRASAAYAENFPSASAVTEDAEDLSGADLLAAAGLGDCTALIGGPPCAAFSIGGVRRVDDDRRDLVMDFARLVRQTRPRYFVMENVPGILLPGARGIVEMFRREVQQAGYKLADPWLLDAAEFGVPQRRLRVFMTGANRGELVPSPPRPSHKATPTARDAIGDLEILEAHRPEPNGEISVPLGPASTYAQRLRGDLLDATDLTRSRLLPAALSGCARVAHSVAVEERFGALQPGSREPISRFLRLHPDRPAPTLRAGTLSSRGGHTAPRPIHYAFPRCITVREAARLQSLPDWFCVDPTKWRGYMQVGNAVPPLLARAVASAILRAARAEKGAPV